MNIVFEISADKHAVRRCTNLLQAVCICGSLCAENIDTMQAWFDEHSPAPIALQRPVGDSSVYDRNPRSELAGNAQEVRPEFRLRNHQELRMQHAKPSSCRKRKVQRKVKDVFCAEPLRCQFLSSVGGG